IVRSELKQDLAEIVGDYKIDLDGEFQKTYLIRSVNHIRVFVSHLELPQTPWRFSKFVIENSVVNDVGISATSVR
ncbi:hypothetical protein P3553_19780, partial [Vibrio parahaemolyticus]|nr:hypothetical protein [Vibrio parahaemolyticus]MDG2686624.1 hypothetical protein [Vibrio parahaemolyticus]